MQNIFTKKNVKKREENTEELIKIKVENFVCNPIRTLKGTKQAMAKYAKVLKLRIKDVKED